VLSEKSEKLRSWLIKNLKNAPPVGSIQEARAVIEFGASRAVLPAGTSVERVMVGAVPSEWVRAAGVATDRVILHLHGGGYTKCSCNTTRLTAAQISAASACSVLVIDYRLAPEFPFPAALEDSTAAYGWLLDQDFKPENIVLLGDSAGGGLAVSTLVSLVAGGERLPCAAVLLSPWVDLTGSGKSMVTRAEADPWMTGKECRISAEMYAAGTDLAYPLISPLFADLSGLPPLLIQVGTDEILLDDSLRLAEKAKAAGGDVTLDVWEGMWHVWHYFAPNLPEGVRGIEKVGEFVRSHLEQSFRAHGQ
jgi:acetyl esterase/lipase